MSDGIPNLSYESRIWGYEKSIQPDAFVVNGKLYQVPLTDEEKARELMENCLV